MQDTTYDVTFSPFRSFTRDEWSKLAVARWCASGQQRIKCGAVNVALADSQIRDNGPGGLAPLILDADRFVDVFRERCHQYPSAAQPTVPEMLALVASSRSTKKPVSVMLLIRGTQKTVPPLSVT